VTGGDADGESRNPLAKLKTVRIKDIAEQPLIFLEQASPGNCWTNTSGLTRQNCKSLWKLTSGA